MAKPFLAYDIDGTAFKSSLLEKTIEEGIDEGLFQAEPFNAAYAHREQWQTSNNEGIYQAYLSRLVGAFVTQIEGVQVERFEQITAKMIAKHSARKFAFTKSLLKATQRSHTPIAISGSPTIIVKPFVEELGTELVYGSNFDVEDGVFTGSAKSVGDKAEILKKLVEEGIVTQKGSIAVGDTKSDIPMLDYASRPIIFNASRTLTRHGKENGWIRVNEVKDQITAMAFDQIRHGYVEMDPLELIDRLPAAS